MATKYDQSSATRPVSIRSHTSAFQVHFKHTSSALEMSSVNPPIGGCKVSDSNLNLSM